MDHEVKMDGAINFVCDNMFFKRLNGESEIVWPSGLADEVWNVNMNGRIIGEISRGKYYKVIADPGDSFLVTPNDRYIPISKDIFEPIYFKTEAGGIYFFEKRFYSRYKQHDMSTGKKLVKGAHLIAVIRL